MDFTLEDKALYSARVQKDLPHIPAGLVMRRAAADDYDDIMEFSKGLYNGIDYLEGSYHRYLSNPLRYLYVGEMNNRTVS